MAFELLSCYLILVFLLNVSWASMTNSKYKQNLVPDPLQRCLLNWIGGFAGRLGVRGHVPLTSC